ncbi:MAG: hypothetical protein QE278_09170 [Limnobacter sp.]|nr:hypothetical protein [Limnobacter sp.]
MGYMHDLPDTYQNSQKRFLEIRTRSWEDADRAHCFDKLLSRPESSSWKSIRVLVVAARNCEVAGEFFADMSHAFDKITRNTLSSGQDTDFVRMGSAVLAKYVARLISTSTLGAPKLLGALFFGLSCLFSAGALGLRQIEKRENYPDPIRLNPLLIENTPIHELEIRSQKDKNKLVNKLYAWGEKTKWPVARGMIKSTGRFLHRTELGQPCLRSQVGNAGYMFKNTHQYTTRTRLLLKLSKLCFNVSNKLLASPDKYVAYVVGTHILGKYVGELLGNRIAFAVTSTAAFLITFFATPVWVAVLHVAAVAALISALLLICAKIDVSVGHGWRGDLKLC